MDSLNTILNSGTYGENVSRHNDNNSKIKQAITTLENVAIANKGYFDTLASLQAAFPSPKAGNIAYVANVASSTGYYIYNVVSGVWTATSTEAPAVDVTISNYAQHGYSSSPKTLKQVDDEVVQLAGEVAIFNVTKEVPLSEGYYTSETARAAVPAPIRKTGLLITYAIAANVWRLEQFVGVGYMQVIWNNEYLWHRMYDSRFITLDWNTDKQTTRLQVPSHNRLPGTVLFYQDSAGTPTMEQYLRTETSDSFFRNSNYYVDIIVSNVFQTLGVAKESLSANLYDYKTVRIGYGIINGKFGITSTNVGVSQLIKVNPEKQYHVSLNITAYQFKENGYYIGTASIIEGVVSLNSDTRYVALYGSGSNMTNVNLLFCETGLEGTFVPFLENDDLIIDLPSYYVSYERISNIEPLFSYLQGKYTATSLVVVDNTGYRTSEKIALIPDTDYCIGGGSLFIFTKNGRFSRSIPGQTTFKTLPYEAIGVLNVTNTNIKEMYLCIGLEKNTKLIPRLSLESNTMRSVDVGSVDNFNHLYATRMYDGCIRIPADLLSDDELTLEFDFVSNFDVHQYEDRLFDIFAFGNSINIDSTTALLNQGSYSVGLKSRIPLSGKYFPDWRTYFPVTWNSSSNDAPIETGSQAEHSNYMRNNLCAEDSFSIRKKEVTSSDYGITFTNENGVLSLKQGGLLIKSYTLSVYATINELVSQMILDLPDYEFEVLSGLYPTSRIAHFRDVYIVCRNISANIPESYPFYVPLNSIGKKYRFKFTIKKTGENTSEAMAFVDGMYLTYSKVLTTTIPFTLKGKYITIGGRIDGESRKFTGEIENITIKNKFEWVKRILLIGTHEPLDDGITPIVSGANISQLYQLFEQARELGYSFISGAEFKRFINNEIEYSQLPDKAIALSYDDSRYDVWTTENHRAALMNIGISPILFIPDIRLPNAPANVIKNLTDYGWEYGSHAWDHVSINLETYQSMIANIELSKQMYKDFKFPKLLCYPMSSKAFFISKLIRHKLGISVFVANGVSGYYGVTTDAVHRAWITKEMEEMIKLEETYITSQSKSANTNGSDNWAYV